MCRNSLFLLSLAALFLSSARMDIAYGASNAVPANYRQLVAQKLLASSNWKIHKARVSHPYQEWMGVINGGTRPVVCAEVFRDTLFGPGGRDLWIFSFQNGRIDSAGILTGAIFTTNCNPVSPLELGKRK